MCTNESRRGKKGSFFLLKKMTSIFPVLRRDGLACFLPGPTMAPDGRWDAPNGVVSCFFTHHKSQPIKYLLSPLPRRWRIWPKLRAINFCLLKMRSTLCCVYIPLKWPPFPGDRSGGQSILLGGHWGGVRLLIIDHFCFQRLIRIHIWRWKTPLDNETENKFTHILF